MKMPARLRPSQWATGSEWSLILLLGTAFLVSRYDFALLGLALPDIQRDLGVREDQLGAFIAYARLGAVAALPLALMADRMGRRRLLIATIAGFTFCSLATAFVSTWQQFAALQFAARAFTAADEMLSVVVVLEEVAARRRGWAVGVLAAMGGIGDGLAAALYPLADQMPGEWRALYVLAAVPLLLLAYVRRSLKETLRFETAASSGALGLGAVAEAIAARPRRFAALVALSLSYHLPISAALSLMSKHLQGSFGYTPGQVALLFIGAGSFALTGNLFGGALADRLGRRNSLAIACIVLAAAFAGFYLGPAWSASVMWLVALTSFFASHAIFLAISGEAFPTVSRATIATLMIAVGALSSAIGLFAEGWLYERLESHEGAIAALLPAFILAALVARMALPETGQHELEDLVENGTDVPQPAMALSTQAATGSEIAGSSRVLD